MYEVFSMTRAGRPLWALIATAILFVVTTILAAFISHHKSRQAEIILDEVRPYQALGVSASFPKGWEVTAAERFSTGRVLVLAPPGSDVRRHLLVFRIRTAMPGTGHLARVAGMVAAIQAVDSDAQMGRPELLPGTSHLGPFESEAFRIAMASSTFGSDVQLVAANVAITPDRHVLGVMLAVEGQITARDRRLLDEVSASVSYSPPENPGRAAPSRDELDGPVDDQEDEVEASPQPLEVDATRIAADLKAAC